ncbi:adhesin [Actinoplanes bogorensis]|uniref:Adhesin n=1 Tax=Paractinoplanes bogorensis TaxID=1610840 RepID=A0ABS5YIE4_9ACTN|nr:adhesin [Actinoplanes bogorensis]MBU2663252.1 adhesin [Actinoplanes bogorensis]
MRATVGPLPSAVYWRRRAVVLGAVLLGIIVLFVSCSGGSDDKGQKQGQTPTSNSSQYPTPEPGSPEPSFLDGQPGANGPSLPAPGDLQSQPTGGDDEETLPPTGGANPGAGTGTGANNNVTAPADGSCADNEIAVTPIPASTNLKRGQSVQIELKIKNNSARTCSRDVGADPQELYIDQGAFKYWSSDTCSTAKGGDVRQLPAGQELTYKVTWNGRQSSTCTGGSPAGPNPPPGQFELRARLGTLVSNPVKLTITS